MSTIDNDNKDEEPTKDNWELPAESDWDFIGGMDDSVAVDELLLPDNTAQ